MGSLESYGILKGLKPKFQPKLLHRYFDDIVEEVADQPALIHKGSFHV